MYMYVICTCMCHHHNVMLHTGSGEINLDNMSALELKMMYRASFQQARRGSLPSSDFQVDRCPYCYLNVFVRLLVLCYIILHVHWYSSLLFWRTLFVASFFNHLLCF